MSATDLGEINCTGMTQQSRDQLTKTPTYSERRTVL